MRLSHRVKESLRLSVFAIHLESETDSRSSQAAAISPPAARALPSGRLRKYQARFFEGREPF